MDVEAGEMTYRPTWRDRLWRRLGFRYHLGNEPDETVGMDKWIMTEQRFAFSLADRLRLLLTGNLHVRIATHFSEDLSLSHSRVDWQILKPGAHHGS